MLRPFWGTFKIAGRARDAAGGQIKSGLRVEAWDIGDGRDEFMGSTQVQGDGSFEIALSEQTLRDMPKDYCPQLVFSVFDGETWLGHVAPSGQPRSRHDLGACEVVIPGHGHESHYVCRPRNIFLKIENMLAYSPVDPDPDAHGMYRRDCMHSHGHADGVIPDAEVEQRKLDAVVFREYLDAAYTIPKTSKLIDADITEPPWYRRVPGTVLYLRPGRRVRVHVWNTDSQHHSFHVHGLAYGIDSDGSFPFGVEGKDGTRSDEICPGDRWTYEFDVREDMVGAWPFHSHVHEVQAVTDLGLFGGIVVRDTRRPHPDIEAPFFMHRMLGARSGAAFDSGNLAPGAAFTYAFPTVGTFNYLCRFHPMSGSVQVVAGGPATAIVNVLDSPARFDPTGVTVAPGGTVEWRHLGLQPHTVTETGGAASLESWCLNGRSFFGNTPVIEGHSGERIRWYMFNLDLGPNWHNFHTHGQRWRWGDENVDTRSLGPAESFIAETRVPDVVLPICRERPVPNHLLKEHHFCGDFLVHCHVEHHMMQGMVGSVRAQQHLALTDAEYAALRFTGNHYCMPLSHGGHGGCPHIDHDRCGSGEGTWESIADCPAFVVHAALMHTGRVLLYSGTAEVGYPPESYVLDAETGVYSGPQAYTEDLFCSGQTFLSDGRLLVAGGAPQFFMASTHIFDPTTETWSKLTGHDMSLGRWYPTLIPLADGRVFAASGRFGVQPMEIFDPVTQNWTVVSGADKDFTELYPSLHLLPNQSIFYSRTGWTAVTGTDAARFDFSGANAGAWTDQSPLAFPDRQEGMAVLMVDDTVSPPNARAIVVGGGVSGAFNRQSCEMIDVSTLVPAPSWIRMADMNFQRTNVNVVLLPDGTVLAIGGQRNGKWAADPAPVLEAELFDPVANTWTVLAAMSHPRQYHSVVVLLPDARVLVAGGIDPTLGGAPARDQRSVEIFSPPYLALGAQPTIASVASNASYATTLTIDSPDALNITSVVLMRPAAVTHHTDAGQRRIQLGITATTATRVTVRMPADGFVAAPGYYMLFILNANGIPSRAAWLRLS